MPFADTPKIGMDQIRPYLTAYTEGSRGVSFDSVRIWNAGFEDHGDWVIEYPKFRVEWRTPAQSGSSQGGGLRLWKRMPEGSLKLHRQLATHDHIP